MKLSPSLLQMIIEAVEKGVRVIIVYGKADLQSETYSRLKKIPKLEIHFVRNLHAKCYFNEESMVLSSMNLYDYSEVNNWEMSIFADKTNDEKLYLPMIYEVKRILRATGYVVSLEPVKSVATSNITPTEKSVSIPDYIKGMRKNMNKVLRELNPSGGHCIRCGDSIPVDYDKPYCWSCYHSWLRYENYDYIEKWCHICSNTAETTIEYPVCLPCLNKVSAKLSKI